MSSPDRSIAEACRSVLLAAEPYEKVRRARSAARAWRRGQLIHRFDAAMPERPSRPGRPELVPANRMPKRGRGGSERGRIAMLHALSHIEFGAIDLAFDMAGRFGAAFPPRFVDDWISIGADEAMHFALLDRRLRVLGSGYGALPAHDGLWEAADETAHDVLARLAVVPMVLEARGLDVTPATVRRFEAAGDDRSAAILERIYRDEIRHVAIGTNWFKWVCESRKIAVVSEWQRLVRTYFRGSLKPPFNDSARGQAGLSREFYEGVDAESFA
ncbi:MAG TPA: ferritin-like domain-containing protein [Allosphingosinicella sp.]